MNVPGFQNLSNSTHYFKIQNYRLEISHCELTSIEIHDVNLEFFMYYGGILEQFVLKNVPLVEMHLGGAIFLYQKDLLVFSSYLPQLEKLTIDGFCMDTFDVEGARMFLKNVKMSKLHHFKFMYPRMCKEMLSVTHFLRAAPLLQSFVLEVYGGSNREESWYFVDSLPEYLGAYEYPHLKRVEMIGYRGTSCELDLAVYLLGNGSALEQFIVDLRKRDNPYMFENYYCPSNINGGLLVGYPCMEEDEINAVKVFVKKQLTRRMDSTLQHLHLNIL